MLKSQWMVTVIYAAALLIVTTRPCHDTSDPSIWRKRLITSMPYQRRIIHFIIYKNILVHEGANRQNQWKKRQGKNVKQIGERWSVFGCILLTMLLLSGDVQLNPELTIPHLNAPVALTMDGAPQQVKSDYLVGELQRNQDLMHLNPRPMISELSVPMLHAADGISHQIKGECFVGDTEKI